MAEEQKKKKKSDDAAPQSKGRKKSKGKKKPEQEAAPVVVAVPPRMRDMYRDKVMSRLMERFQYRNPMQVPKVAKVVINMGCGNAITNTKIIDGALADMNLIAGQKPSVRRSRLSVSNFKLRAGMPVGVAVTLRRERMWEFLDRLLTFAIPRIRDFRGISRHGFDGRGNFAFGLKEQTIFPEIEYDAVDQLRGMDICIVTTAETDEEAYELLSELGMPFARQS
jgi:large subunit ribosomal protein L5